MSLEEKLSRVLDWPVDNAAASLVGVGDEVVTAGDTDRVFELASVTKLLSAYGFLMAIEEGVCELDDDLGPAGSTVRHLFSHASGIGFHSRDPQRDVAERRIYSSAGFEWLAEHIERESGIAFSDYLAEGIFQPLGMQDTELSGSAGHDGRSTVKDLTRFVQELLQPTLLAEETVREAMTIQFPGLIGIVPGYGMQKPCDWGLGFEIKSSKSPHWTGKQMPPETVGHFGMAGTFIWVVPSSSTNPLAGTAMVALSDRDFGAWAKPLWQETNDEIANAIVSRRGEK